MFTRLSCVRKLQNKAIKCFSLENYTGSQEFGAHLSSLRLAATCDEYMTSGVHQRFREMSGATVSGTTGMSAHVGGSS